EAAAEQQTIEAYVVIGTVQDGLVGGLSVAREEAKNGTPDFWDVMLGAAIGAAVGGWASYATVYGPAAPGKLTGEGLGKAALPGQDILSGALNNAIVQTGIGFAHAIARPIARTGGADLDFAKDIAQSAISGYASGVLQGVVLGPIIPKLTSLNTP